MMMARPQYWQPEFRKLDPAAVFVVTKPTIRLDGETLPVGSVVDRAKVDNRRLRQFYEQRRVGVATPPLQDVAPAPAATPDAPPALAVRHVGHGKFCVMQGADRITDPKSKEDAEADLAILVA